MSLKRPEQEKESRQPSKLFYRIGEISRITGLEPHVLRYWETEFPHLRPEKRKSGQRLYTRTDLDNILHVKQLLYRDGFTITGAKRKIRGRSGRDVDEVIESAKREIRELLDLLNSH